MESNIKKIAVFGAAGKMGMGIVETIISLSNFKVFAFDVGLRNADRQKEVNNRFKLELFHLKNGKKLLFQSSDGLVESINNVTWLDTNPTNMESYLPECDIIVEAVFENEDIKKNLYREIEKYAKPNACIFTNTSTIGIKRLAEALEHKERFLGFHFFNPVPVMKCVEVILHPAVSVRTLMMENIFSIVLDKRDFMAPDIPGFTVNGAYVPAIKQFFMELEAGASFEEIDKAFTSGKWVVFPPARRIVDVLINECKSLVQKYKEDPMLRNHTEEQARDNIENLMKFGTNMPTGPFELDELLQNGKAEEFLKKPTAEGKWKLCLATGPAFFTDLVGEDVAMHCVESMAKQAPERGWQVPELLKKMVAEKKLGLKTGEGFYKYGPQVEIEYPEPGYAKILFENGKRNALSAGLIKKLRSAFSELAAKPDLKAVFLQGAGDIFATGADIGEFPLCLLDAEVRRLAIQEGRLLLEQIINFPVPVIAVVEKFALGGGYEIPLACDIIIAASKSKIGLPEKGLGILPGWLGTQTLARRIGRENAQQMILGAEIIEVNESEPTKLVDVVFKKGELTWAKLKVIADGAKKRKFNALHYSFAERLDYYKNLACLHINVLLGKEPKAALLALKAIWRGNKLSLSEGGDVELKAILAVFKTEDAEKGIRHFLETGKHLYKS